jgi:hypothetical protein
MTTHSLQSNQVLSDNVKCNNQQSNLQIAQERLYDLLIDIVQTSPPAEVLYQFQQLLLNFIDEIKAENHENALVDHEQEFKHTIKRCCYIIINNWESKRNYQYIQELLQGIASHQFWGNTTNTKRNIYRTWLENFVNSNDYAELKSGNYKYDKPAYNQPGNNHWVNRYTSYLLVAQSFDINRPKEQQEAAKKLSKQMKDKFKFELAMYIARSQSAASHITRYKNPTILGDEVLRLIKMIVVRRGVFSYENLANIFVKQTKQQNLLTFKESIQKYLFYTADKPALISTVKQQLGDKLSNWRAEYDEEIINNNLLLRVCNKLIDYLTTENGQEPSSLFILLLSQGHPLTLVIVLLKIILVCKNSRSHLEVRIAHLIKHYEKYPEDECKWFINFLEMFNITFAIYAENVEYNLIKMGKEQPDINPLLNLDAYRVFSQLKKHSYY